MKHWNRGLLLLVCIILTVCLLASCDFGGGTAESTEAPKTDAPTAEVTEPEEIEPEGTEPEGTEPEGTEPEEPEPEGTEPEGTEPEETEPEETEPEGTEPEGTEPEETEPEGTEPEGTEPEETEPEGTEPEGTEPEGTEPEATEPEETEPEGTDPEGTEPEGTEPEEPEPEPEPAGISFLTLAVSGTDVSGCVPYATEYFSFLNEIKTTGDATYTVSLDIYGLQSVVTKTVVLDEGDNVFYVLESAENALALYTVTIHRNRMCTVTFYTNGGDAIAAQAVEEGSSISAPKAARVGYTFTGWFEGDEKLDSDAWIITKDMRVRAEWAPNEDTPYTVTHALESLDGTFEVTESERFVGVSDGEVTPATKSYEGFVAPEAQTATVASDGSLVVEYRYTRYRSTVTFDGNGGSTPEALTLKYGQAYSLRVPVLPDYEFLGWFEGDVPLASEGEWCITRDVTVRAAWKLTENEPSDFIYTRVGSGIELQVYCGKRKDVAIPAYIDGLPVMSIGGDAFYYCESLTSIVIPDSVTSIGESAFYGCDSLTSVTFGESSKLTSIGERAFYDCDSLTSIVIPDSVTSIGERAFCECYSLTSVTFGESSKLTSIGERAFDGCGSLTSIVIPDSVTSIGSYAFDGCDSLTSIEIPASVTSIGEGAFQYCSALTSVTFGESSKLTSIGSSAFFYCDSLTSIEIPASVTSIGSYAFYGCERLTSITIPDSVTSIGRYAFSDCDSLTSVTFGESSKLTSIGDGAFCYCESLVSITIPDSVTSIGESAFYCCERLTRITIPDSVTSIGDGAFSWCSALEELTVAEGNPNYHSEGNCIIETSSMTLIAGCKNSVIPDGVRSIGRYAFSSSESLNSITIPDSVTYIGRYAFYGCSGLTNVYYGGTESEWNAIAVEDGNQPLLDATVYYYSETEPETAGNYWHYGADGAPVVW